MVHIALSHTARYQKLQGSLGYSKRFVYDGVSKGTFEGVLCDVKNADVAMHIYI